MLKIIGKYLMVLVAVCSPYFAYASLNSAQLREYYKSKDLIESSREIARNPQKYVSKLKKLAEQSGNNPQASNMIMRRNILIVQAFQISGKTINPDRLKKLKEAKQDKSLKDGYRAWAALELYIEYGHPSDAAFAILHDRTWGTSKLFQNVKDDEFNEIIIQILKTINKQQLEWMLTHKYREAIHTIKRHYARWLDALWFQDVDIRIRKIFLKNLLMVSADNGYAMSGPPVQIEKIYDIWKKYDTIRHSGSQNKRALIKMLVSLNNIERIKKLWIERPDSRNLIKPELIKYQKKLNKRNKMINSILQGEDNSKKEK